MSKQFSVLGIEANFLKSLTALQIEKPTDIQEKVIPAILNEKADVIALAKTGTGKTAAFGLPLLQLINTQNDHVQAIILAPTRELGHQIFNNMVAYAANSPNVSIASACGGIPIKPQIERLKATTHVVVATPGRLVDLIERGAINVSKCAILVLDEADEMVTALKDSLEQILKKLPKKKRTFLFTATLSGAIRQLVNNFLSKEVVSLEANMETLGHQGIDHQFVVVEPIEKLSVLLHFLNTRAGEQGIIFCKTKAAVNKLAKNLAINKFSSGALHGSLSQPIRDRVMGQFREGQIDLLVATDLAARGLDVKDISYVVNYHLPETYETYVHRSGRTARAGKQGMSLTVLQKEEVEDVADFSSELGIHFTEMPKADAQSIEDNNTLLWARKVFKIKPNREISEDVKKQVKTVFHHLTKDELVEKVLAFHLAANGATGISSNTKQTKK